MEHVAFRIRARMKSPILLREEWPSLDGILAAAIFSKTGSVEKAHSEIPLARTEDVWHGSTMKMIFEGRLPKTKKATIFGGLMVSDIDPPVCTLSKGEQKKIEVGRGKYLKKSLSYSSWNPSFIEFVGVGDPEQTLALLSSYVFSIGSGRQRGEGSVGKWMFPEEMEDDRSMVFPSGSPARPIPVDLWKTLGNVKSRARIEYASIAPPYWNGDRVLCASPVIEDLVPLEF